MGFVHFYDDVDRVKELFVQKLASSGITAEQAVAIGMKPLLGKIVKNMGYWRQSWGGLPALYIGYVDPWTGEPVLRNGMQMHRVRALAELEGSDFKKYLQPPRTGAAAYFANVVDWRKVLADPTVPLIITEGELKAAKACLEGFLTIAIGGVWSFKTKAAGEGNDRLLPELAKITWTGRRVTIIFDSDITEKLAVQEALRRLANLLIDAGGLVFQATLPPDGNGKVGIDDLLITKGGTVKLKRLLAAAEPLTATSWNSAPGEDWASSLQRTSEGQPLATLANALTALRRAPALAGLVAFDEMLRATMVTRDLAGSRLAPVAAPRRQTDNDVLAITEWLQRNELRRIGEGVVRQAVTKAAEEHRYHPIRNNLDVLRWDGKKRNGSWLHRYLGAQGTRYHSEIGRLFLISMVARVMRPGCKVDYMLVLEGNQGLLKSTVCRILAGDEYFSDMLPNLRHADEVRLSMHLRGKWLIEIPELSSFNKAESAELKAFLTRQDEIFIAKYGHAEVKEPRQCVFIGTTNQDFYLRDETGDRRSWPVKGGVYQIDDLRRDRDQLLAEAVVEYRAGAKWWPEPNFEATVIKPEQEARHTEDILAAPINEFAEMLIKAAKDTRKPVAALTIMRIADGCLGSHTRAGPGDANRIRGLLKRGGWVIDKVHTRHGQAWKPPGWEECEPAVTRRLRVIK